MKLSDLILRVRSYTRDFSNSIFREQDIIDFVNEGIDRFKEVIPQLSGLTYLIVKTDVPALIPSAYQYLLAVYSASRCFSQDGNDYKSGTLMNEFESKLDELNTRIEDGRVTIIDPVTGLAVTTNNSVDYVDLTAYWKVTPVDEVIV